MENSDAQILSLEAREKEPYGKVEEELSDNRSKPYGRNTARKTAAMVLDR